MLLRHYLSYFPSGFNLVLHVRTLPLFHKRKHLKLRFYNFLFFLAVIFLTIIFTFLVLKEEKRLKLSDIENQTKEIQSLHKSKKRLGDFTKNGFSCNFLVFSRETNTTDEHFDCIVNYYNEVKNLRERLTHNCVHWFCSSLFFGIVSLFFTFIETAV